MTTINNLPYHIMKDIFDKLNNKDKINFGKTSKKFNNAFKKDMHEINAKHIKIWKNAYDFLKENRMQFGHNNYIGLCVKCEELKEYDGERDKCHNEYRYGNNHASITNDYLEYIYCPNCQKEYEDRKENKYKDTKGTLQYISYQPDPKYFVSCQECQKNECIKCIESTPKNNWIWYKNKSYCNKHCFKSGLKKFHIHGENLYKSVWTKEIQNQYGLFYSEETDEESNEEE